MPARIFQKMDPRYSKNSFEARKRPSPAANLGRSVSPPS